jgi:hypothetical protein
MEFIPFENFENIDLMVAMEEPSPDADFYVVVMEDIPQENVPLLIAPAPDAKPDLPDEEVTDEEPYFKSVMRSHRKIQRCFPVSKIQA